MAASAPTGTPSLTIATPAPTPSQPNISVIPTLTTVPATATSAAQSQPSVPSKPNFKALLEGSRQLYTDVDEGFTLQRTVEQVEETSKRLAAKSTKGAESDVAKTKAQYLLASKSFDVDRLSRLLTSIDLRRTFEPLEPLTDTDIEGFLKHEHEMIVLTAIEESKQETIKRIDENYTKSLVDDWEVAKKELMELLGMKSGAYSSAVFAPPTPSRVAQLNLTPSRRGRSMMDAKMMECARVILQLNEHRSKERPFDIIAALCDVAARIDDKDTRKGDVIDTWNILRYMLASALDQDGGSAASQTPATVNSASAISERFFAQVYAENSSRLRRQLNRGARRFLEAQYQRVRAFLKVFLARNMPWPTELEAVIDDFPIWAELYYLLRSGEVSAAVELATVAESILGNNIVSALREYARSDDGRLLSRNVRELLESDWKRSASQSADPYKQLVFAIIGKFETKGSFPSVIKSTQDFMWLKLALIREADTAAAAAAPPTPSTPGGLAPTAGLSAEELLARSSVHSLERLQTLLYHTYGAAHFNKKGRNPLLYFQVLLMSQQFERAIYYLVTTDGFAVEAVHFAVALYYAGLLRQPPPEKAASDALYADEPKPVLNFERLLRQYVRAFADTDPLEAVHYYALVQSRERRHACIKELVLETREFDLLLGSISPEGTRKPGYIEKFVGREEAARITELAAFESEQQGRHDDAIKLFELVENYDKAIAEINEQLSKCLVRGPDRERWVATARALHSRYGATLNRVRDSRLLQVFQQLLTLVNFFDLYHAGKLEDALETVEKLKLIPLDPNNKAEEVEIANAARSHAGIDECIARNFAEILLATMSVLYKLYTNLKSQVLPPGVVGDGGRENKLRLLRAKARLLITFFGMIQYRMPLDTHSRLIKMDVWMNS